MEARAVAAMSAAWTSADLRAGVGSMAARGWLSIAHTFSMRKKSAAPIGETAASVASLLRSADVPLAPSPRWVFVVLASLARPSGPMLRRSAWPWRSFAVLAAGAICVVLPPSSPHLLVLTSAATIV